MPSSAATEYWFIGPVATVCGVFIAVMGNAMNARTTSRTSDKPGTRVEYGRLSRFYFGCVAAWFAIVGLAIVRIWSGAAGWTAQNLLYATNGVLFILWAASAWSHRRTKRDAERDMMDAMRLHNGTAKIPGCLPKVP